MSSSIDDGEFVYLHATSDGEVHRPMLEVKVVPPNLILAFWDLVMPFGILQTLGKPHIDHVHGSTKTTHTERYRNQETDPGGKLR